MRKIVTCALISLLATCWIWIGRAAAEDKSKLQGAKQRIENITNYNTPRVSTAPVQRITPTGTQPMVPNAKSQYGPARGVRYTAPPAPQNPNYRYNTQGRNINPTGDKNIAKGFDSNQNRKR